MLWLPRLRVESAALVAVPPLTATGGPKFRLSTTNWTVPPGLLPMVGVTWAVKVSESPIVAEDSDEVTNVDVGSVVTVNGELVEAAASDPFAARDAVTV